MLTPRWCVDASHSTPFFPCDVKSRLEGRCVCTDCLNILGEIVSSLPADGRSLLMKSSCDGGLLRSDPIENRIEHEVVTAAAGFDECIKCFVLGPVAKVAEHSKAKKLKEDEVAFQKDVSTIQELENSILSVSSNSLSFLPSENRQYEEMLKSARAFFAAKAECQRQMSAADHGKRAQRIAAMAMIDFIIRKMKPYLDNDPSPVQASSTEDA